MQTLSLGFLPRPPGPRCLLRACPPLLRRQLPCPGLPALEPAQPPQRHRRRVLLSLCHESNLKTPRKLKTSPRSRQPTPGAKQRPCCLNRFQTLTPSRKANQRKRKHTAPEAQRKQHGAASRRPRAPSRPYFCCSTVARRTSCGEIKAAATQEKEHYARNDKVRSD